MSLGRGKQRGKRKCVLMAQGAMRWGLLHCASNSGASVPQPLSDLSAHAHCEGKGYPGAGQEGVRESVC